MNPPKQTTAERQVLARRLAEIADIHKRAEALYYEPDDEVAEAKLAKLKGRLAVLLQGNAESPHHTFN